jgi:Protein of unknown function (DUF3667)
VADEVTKLIVSDTAISAIEEPGKRRFFSRKNRPPPLSHCENCGTLLSGKYCSQCGQPAIDYRRSFRHVIVDVLDSFLNWDSKFIHTIGLLITRPWRLTNEFLAGHRVRYLHPARLYLLTSIVFFFAATFWFKSIKIDPVNFSMEQRNEVKSELERENVPAEDIAKVDRILERGFFSPNKRSEIEEQLKLPGLTDKERANLEEKLKIGNEVAANIDEAMKDLSPKIQETVDRALKDAARNKPKTALEVTDSKEAKTPFENWIESRAREKFGESGNKAQLFFTTLISNLPYMVLACIPLFAFVLKILYIRKRIFYIDHLVYALHIHTFAYFAIMLIVLITMGLNRAMPGALAGWVIGLLWATFVVQIFLSIRRVYCQGWFFSIFKFFVGGFVYLIVLFLALAVTFFITLAMPA